jgi:hypothetical protein
MVPYLADAPVVVGVLVMTVGVYGAIRMPDEKKPATEVAPRHPDDMLRAASEERATLVAVGSRGLSVAKRVLLGSVSDSVLKAAGGPVLIAPSSADAGSPKDDNAPEHPRHRGRQAPASKTPRRANANTRAGGY